MNDKVTFHDHKARPITLGFMKLHDEAVLPRRWSAESVGYDLHAFCLSENGHPIKRIIPPRSTTNLETRLAIEPPPGHFVMVCSRSGLAKHSIFVANAPGIIDPDYRGEVRVLLYNGGIQNHFVEHGARIAQLVVVPATTLEIVARTKLSETERGENGLGSTGA